jgi:hypothetical protein
VYVHPPLEATSGKDEWLFSHPGKRIYQAASAIGHTFIRKTKCIDALAVILIGLPSFDQLTRPYDRFTYFMGASRARQLLACVHSV